MNEHLKSCFFALLGVVAFGACVVGKISAQTSDETAARTRNTAAKSQIAALGLAIDSFEVDTGKFPKTLDELVTAPKDMPAWKGPYLAKVSLDPWNHPYLYVCPSTQKGKDFDLISYGADGKPGGGDDITYRPTTDNS